MRKITVHRIKEAPASLITGATLLSVEEAEKLPRRMRQDIGRWWLRSPGTNQFRVAGVIIDQAGAVKDVGVTDDRIKVRPALQLANLESSGLMVGDRFRFGDEKFEVISDDIAFCVGYIGRHAFRDDWEADNACFYEASDVRRYVEEWFNNALFQGIVTGIGLLPLEELRYVPRRLRSHRDWWLSSEPGARQLNAAYVYRDGRINSIRDDNGYAAVRPALELKSSNLKIGNRFEFGGTEFEVVSDNLAFCVSDLGRCRMDETVALLAAFVRRCE